MSFSDGLCSDMRRWYTPIHEAHDACKQQLIDFKKEVENLEQQRKSFQRQHKNKTEEEAEEEKKPDGEAEKETIETNTKETPDKNASEKVSIDSLLVIQMIKILPEDRQTISRGIVIKKSYSLNLTLRTLILVIHSHH